ncbi:MAG TPA: hypothetical protein DCY15_05075 [Ruminococcaceae bacterium]|nr:hypothetical protein [Oscillospiraceae bacterium]
MFMIKRSYIGTFFIMMGINCLTALWFSAPGLTKFNVVEITLLCFKNVEYISVINSLFSAAIVGSIVIVAASYIDNIDKMNVLICSRFGFSKAKSVGFYFFHFFVSSLCLSITKAVADLLYCRKELFENVGSFIKLYFLFLAFSYIVFLIIFLFLQYGYKIKLTVLILMLFSLVLPQLSKSEYFIFQCWGIAGDRYTQDFFLLIAVKVGVIILLSIIITLKLKNKDIFT